MYLPVEPGRLIGGRKIEDALYHIMWQHLETLCSSTIR